MRNYFSPKYLIGLVDAGEGLTMLRACNGAGVERLHCARFEHNPSHVTKLWLSTAVVTMNPSKASPVLHLLAPTREGGLEQVVIMMSAGQKSRGVHVAAVITPEEASDHPFTRRLEAVGVPFTSVIVGARDYLAEYRALSALVKRLEPTLLHTHGYRADIIGGIVARAHGISAVSTVHGFTAAGRRVRIYERLQCLVLRRSDAVIAVSLPLVDRLARAAVPRERIHHVPNGFLPILRSAERGEARKKLGIGTDELVAGWVGRLSTEKGGDVMLAALAQAPPSWKLAMIGDGPQRDVLRHQAERLGLSDRVYWCGATPSAGSQLAAFDAFVLSSRTEGTPIALLEAMHAGVPIVATRVGGVPDVVRSDHALLVSSDRPDMIARALAEIEADPSAARRRSTLARERLRTAFGCEVWLAAVDAVYKAASARTARSKSNTTIG